jgi:hypothetical protein
LKPDIKKVAQIQWFNGLRVEEFNATIDVYAILTVNREPSNPEPVILSKA